MKPSDKSVDLVEELKLLLNFTYELIELDDEDQDIFGSVRKIYVGEKFSKLVTPISYDGTIISNFRMYIRMELLAV